MPANLTPEYFKAEEAYREAKTTQEKLRGLEYMLSVIPKHKGTDHMVGGLRRRISKLKQGEEKKRGKKTPSYLIRKEGAAQVAVIGAPNVGKSSLVGALTKAKVEVAAYAYTTRTPVPGMMQYENTQIQLLDTPAMTKEFMESWQPDLVRRADAALLLADAGSDEACDRLGEIVSLLADMRIHLVGEELPEEMDPICAYRRTMLLPNKCDQPDAAERIEVIQEIYGDRFPIVPVSAATSTGLEELPHKLYKFLRVLRVYTKVPGRKPDLTDPFVLPIGSTVVDLARSVHKELAYNLRSARIWGSSKHAGQHVKRDYVLQEGDILELHE